MAEAYSEDFGQNLFVGNELNGAFKQFPTKSAISIKKKQQLSYENFMKT